MQYRGERGATLLDVVVGSALMTLVFVGFVGAFRLTIDAVSNNKARAGAIALANERLEYIRSLAYTSIGTVGGIPAGVVPQTEAVSVNDVAYTRRVFVSYEDDPNDGIGAGDTNGVTADYKAAKVTVSWDDRGQSRTITLVTRISPTGIETAVPGGTLSILVVNASSTPVSNAEVDIVNSGVSPAVSLTTYTDVNGQVSLIGAPAGAGYEITATKAGYSTAQTYSATAENTNPSPAHLGVSNDQTTAATFAIDIVGSKTLQTLLPIARATTTDTYLSSAMVASNLGTVVAGGIVQLTENVETGYIGSGTIRSTAISTTTLNRWRTLAWIDSEPASSEIRYRIYDGSGAALVPDAQLSGNSAGFTTSPIDLSNIATSSFPTLAIHATLTTGNPSSTPSIDSWSLSNDSGPIPLPDITLSLVGAKTIGTGPGGLVYKYSTTTLSSGAAGSLVLSNMEWDSYTTSVGGSTYAVSSACAPQPESLYPGLSRATQLYFTTATTHSLLVDVKSPNDTPIANASVRIFRTTAPAYDTTIAADACGNAYFGGMGSGTGATSYSIEVSASGYTTYSASDVNVSGTSRVSVILN